ncbi:hotdog fold thioesterase [Leucobacter albus]|uniref:Hotdog fold thioesterase n=1 Tax=Leucobacter albus TaxID=272210 RepID=A0ABW3TQX6_9MICO
MTEHDAAAVNRFGVRPGDTTPDLEQVASLGLGALADSMGIKLTEFSRERVVATMPVEGNTQPYGLVNGGAYAVLGETLGSMHAGFLAPEGKLPVGVDINATHTGSATQGLITAVCTPIHAGRSMTVHEIICTDDNGRRCSTLRITNFYKTAPGA